MHWDMALLKSNDKFRKVDRNKCTLSNSGHVSTSRLRFAEEVFCGYQQLPHPRFGCPQLAATQRCVS
jgi:hypothetical protein